MERREALKGLAALAALPLVGELPVKDDSLKEAFVYQLWKSSEFRPLLFVEKIEGVLRVRQMLFNDLATAHLQWEVDPRYSPSPGTYMPVLKRIT